MGTSTSTDFWGLPPAEEWWYLAAVLGSLLSLLGLGEFLRRSLGVSHGFTRKLIHVSVGIVVSFAPGIFSAPLPAILLAVLFVLLNLAALRRGWFSSMHGTDRTSLGTVYFPLAFLILVFLFWYRHPLIISASMLVLALGDAVGAVVGESHKAPAVFRLSSDKKSLEGSFAMLVVSFVTLSVGVMVLQPGRVEYDFLFAVAGVAAVTGTAWEALSSRGLDNLTVPLSVAFVLSYYMLPDERTDIRQFTSGTGFSLLLAAASYRATFLSLSGSVATFLLASVVFGVGGWKWGVPILTFFVLSSFLSHAGKIRKARPAEMFEQTATRDHAQVFANGGVGGILALLSFAFPSFDFYPLFVGSIAAVTADTWSTELGLLGRGRTIMITTMKSVESGRSGGITWLGLVAGFVGGTVIGFSAMEWTGDLVMTGVFALAGLTGSVVDSILGATVQAEYKCPECGNTTERQIHCSNRTLLVKGFRWMNNDAVNWFCALSGAGAAAGTMALR